MWIAVASLFGFDPPHDQAVRPLLPVLAILLSLLAQQPQSTIVSEPALLSKADRFALKET